MVGTLPTGERDASATAGDGDRPRRLLPADSAVAPVGRLILLVLAVAWLAGAAYLLIRLIAGAVFLRRVVRHASVLESPGLAPPAARGGRPAGLAPACLGS